MDIFAYVTLGLCGVLALAWVMAWLVVMLSEGLGRALLLGVLLRALVVCGIVSAVWLIGTKLI